MKAPKKNFMLVSDLYKKFFLVSFIILFAIPLVAHGVEDLEEFNITPDKLTVGIGETVTITAIKKRDANNPDGTVLFAVSPTGGTLSSRSCELETELLKRKCSVTFRTSKSGIYTFTGIHLEQQTVISTPKRYQATTSVTVTENISSTTTNETKTNYVLLEPLPGLENFESNKECAFGRYLNIIIKLFLGICAVLAVIMIVYGGLEYMLSSTPASKEAKKTTITNAIFGLIIALGAYLLLYTINPRLLDVCLDQQIPTVSLTIDGDSEAPITSEPTAQLAKELPSGIICAGTALAL